MANWRDYGDMPFADFEAELERLNSPMLAEAEEAYGLLKGVSRLFLAMAFHETKLGTLFTVPGFDASFKNPVALMTEGRYLDFPNWWRAALAWKERLVTFASTYKGGVYARTTTLEDLIHVYAPSSAGNDAARYVAVVKERLAAYGYKETPPMPDYNFDPDLVPFPPMQMMIVQKPGERAGFDRVPFRGPRIVGICDHITAGQGTIPGYRDFFSTGGERAWDALVDVLIDKQGNAAWYNYPYDPNLGGTRSPWASGGSDGLEGDGPAFVRALGIEGINGRLVSKEHVLVEGEAVPGPMLLTSARITAAVMQRAKVPWDKYPLNPNVGCVTHMQHFEFATKPCPGTVFRNATDRMQDLVRAILKTAQQTGTGTTKPPVTTTAAPSPTPVPPPKPVENPAHDLYPDGMGSYEQARAAFGTGERHRADGTSHGFGFNEKSAVSLAWLERGAAEKSWPQVDEWWQLVNSSGTERNVVTFKQAGWVLVHFADRAGWRWV